MNPSQQIKKWIEDGKPYAMGVDIYREHGDNATLKNLFGKFDSQFYKDKLLVELTKMQKEAELINIITPKEVVIKEYTANSPLEKLRELDKQKAFLFKEILKTRTEIKKILKLKTIGRISIADALSVMTERDKHKRLKPFSVTYVSLNQSRKTGGDVLRFEQCILRVENKMGSKIMMGKKYYQGNQPRHWVNSTRNFHPIGGNKDDIKKLHIWLMFEFNGMEVVTSELG